MAQLFLASEDGNGLDVRGLGEEVEEVKFGKGVAGGGEDLEIGQEGFGRAGDVDDGRCGDASEQRADLAAGTRTRWIEDDEAGAVTVKDGSTKEFKGGGFDGAEVGEPG